MFFTVLLLCAFIALLLYYFLHYEKFVRPINNIPSMPGLPVLGHTIDMWKCSQGK